MEQHIDQSNGERRNAFTALCDFAFREHWCWKICCTTCGHSAFKVCFSKIIHGQHPDDDAFWSHGKSNHSPLKEMENYPDFKSLDASASNQIKLATIVAQAQLSDIRIVAMAPDWLGYIGLVIHHCTDNKARKIISDSFLPQFITLFKDDQTMSEYLKTKQSGNELLSLDDLNRIENNLDYYDPELINASITDINKYLPKMSKEEHDYYEHI